MNINLNSWAISDEDTFSDHKLITFQYNKGPLPTASARNLKNADWETFQTLTETDTPNTDRITMEWLESEAGEIIQIINRALDEVAPMKPVTNKIKKQPYWTTELNTLKLAARQAYRHATRSGGDQAWDAMVETRRVFRQALRKEKKASWHKHVEKASTPKELAKLFKSIQKQENPQVRSP